MPSPSGGGAKRSQQAGRGQKIPVRVLGVDAALDGVAVGPLRRRQPRQILAPGEAELQAHQVEARDHLRRRVLHLDARVHLQEVERAVRRQDELDRAGAAVTLPLHQGQRGVRHARPQRRVHRRGRRLLDDLLKAALHRAFALHQVEAASVAVPENLDLDVTRLEHQLLQVDRAVAERALGHGLGRADHVRELGRVVHLPHADAAAARRCLDQQGKAHRLGRFVEAGEIVRREPGAAGDDGKARVTGDGAGTLLVPHGGDAVGRRADPDEAGLLHRPGEGGVFGEEAVARMDRIGAALPRRRDDLVRDEIALLRRRRPDGKRLVGLRHVAGVGVGLRIDRNRGDAERPCAPHDPAGNLAPVCDQEFLHGDLYVYLAKPSGTTVIEAEGSCKPSKY